MAYISDELFNEINMANDIVDYASSFMTLKKRGRNYMACCPFHNEKTPSFNIDRDKQLFHCFGCGASGNFVQLVMRLEGLDFQDAIKQMADRAGIAIPENGTRAGGAAAQQKERIYEMNKLAARYFYDCLNDPEKGRAGREYFAARRLSKKTMTKFGLGYATGDSAGLINSLKAKGYSEADIVSAGLAVSRNEKAVDKFRDRVMFPIINARGKIIGFGGRIMGSEKLPNGVRLAKYLNSPETPVFDKGSNLFALNLAKNSNEKDIILCEGYMDVITVHQAGISNCVATLGTAITENQAKLMLRYANEILICYDMDEAGTKAALRAIDIIASVGGKARVIRITGAKDPDEFITKYGVQGFRKAIDKAMPSTEFRLSLIKREYDINDTDGKIRFVEAAARILASLGDPVEVEAYIKKIAAETGISEQSIVGKYKEIKSKMPRRSPAQTKEAYKKRELMRVNSGRSPAERVSSATLEAEKRVLSLMSASKRLTLEAAEIISPEEFSDKVYKDMAEYMYSAAKKGEEVDPAAVINRFSGDAESENKAGEVFFNREEYTDNEKTLYDLIYKIKQDRLEAQISAEQDAKKIGELLRKKAELTEQQRTKTTNK
ncbi:MAG: DNA primase [Clostridia bacterium]|nr:DNA primase [Clostridia bacterium]